jgi:hypothetical protein
MSSWREKRVGGTVVAATMLLIAAALAGCGGGGDSVSSSSGSTTQTAAASAGTTSTATGATTSTTHSKPAASTKPAPQQSTKASTSPSTSKNVAPTPGGRLLRHFAGSGNTGLGTLVIRSRAVLSWNAARPPIQIFTARGFLLVSSHAASGSVQLSRGTYTGMRVATHAGWTIELRTRS